MSKGKKRRDSDGLQPPSKAIANDRMMRSPVHFQVAGADRQVIPGRRPNSLSRKILPLLILISALCFQLSAFSATVYGNARGLNLVNLNTTIVFTPTNAVLISGTNLNAGPPIAVPLVNGYFSTNLDGGNYTVSLPLIPWRKSFLIAVPTDTASYNITTLMSPPMTYTYVNNYSLASVLTNGGTAYLTSLQNNLGKFGTLTITNYLSRGAGTIFMDVANSIINDNNELTAGDFNNRQLKNAVGVTLLNWSGSSATGTFAGDATGLTNLNIASAPRRAEYMLDDTNYFNNPPAVGDLAVAYPVSMALSGNTLTWTSGNFKPSDQNKLIMVYGAGNPRYFVNEASNKSTNGETCLAGTITGYISASQVTVSFTALTNVTARSAVYGTDNAQALIAAWNFCAINQATLIVPAKGYGYAWTNQDPWPLSIGSAALSTSFHANAMFTLNGLTSSQTERTVLKYVGIKGVIPPGAGYAANTPGCQMAIRGPTWWMLSIPPVPSNNLTPKGSLFNCEEFTNWIFASADASHLRVNRPPGYEAIWFSDYQVVIDNMRFAGASDPQYAALDLRGAPNALVGDTGKVLIDCGYGTSDAGIPTYTNAAAVQMPETLCSGINSLGQVTVNGFYIGRTIGEHLVTKNFLVLGAWYGTLCQFGGHEAVDILYDCEDSKYCFKSQMGFTLKGNLTCEGFNTNAFYYPFYVADDRDILGTSGNLKGYVNVDSGQTTLNYFGCPHFLIDYTPYTTAIRTWQGQIPIVNGNLTVVSNTTSGSLLTTNVDAAGVTATFSRAGTDAGNVRIKMMTGNGAGVYFEKIQAFGNSTYDNAFNILHTDLYDTQVNYVSWGTNNFMHLNGSLVGGADVSQNLAVQMPQGFNCGTAAGTNTLYIPSAGSIKSAVNGLNVIRASDNANVIYNPVSASGGIFLCYDQGGGAFGGVNFGNGAAGIVGSMDLSGNFKWSGVATGTGTGITNILHITTSASTSGTVTAATSYQEETTYLSSGSTIASITIALPTTGVLGQQFLIHSKSAVTALTVTGGSFLDTAVTTMTAGQTIGYQMQNNGGAYIRIQ